MSASFAVIRSYLVIIYSLYRYYSEWILLSISVLKDCSSTGFTTTFGSLVSLIKLCADAWQEMEKYASLVGINFNEKKTAGVCIGGELEPSLPRGAVAWGIFGVRCGEGAFRDRPKDGGSAY